MNGRGRPVKVRGEMKSGILRLRRAFLALFLSAFSFSVSADPAVNSRKASSGISMVGLEALESSKKPQLLRLLDSLQVPFTGLMGAEWRRRKGTYLVVLTDTTEGEQNSKHTVYAFNVSRPKIELMATPSYPFTFAFDDKVDGFDFAPYQITPNEFAFGIRYSRHRYYATGDASMGGIMLFRINNFDINEIANISTSYETNLAGEWNEDRTRDRIMLAETAVVLVTKKKTAGYFDWIKKAESGKSVRLNWDGNGYALRGTDPFPIKEYAIFDVEGP